MSTQLVSKCAERSISDIYLGKVEGVFASENKLFDKKHFLLRLT